MCRYVRMGRTAGMVGTAVVMLAAVGYVTVVAVTVIDVIKQARTLQAFIDFLFSGTIIALFVGTLGYGFFRSWVLQSQAAFGRCGAVRIEFNRQKVRVAHVEEVKEWPWDLMMGFEEGRTIFLLMTKDAFLVIPKAAVPVAAHEGFCAMCQSETAVRERTRAFPVEMGRGSEDMDRKGG